MKNVLICLITLALVSPVQAQVSTEAVVETPLNKELLLFPTPAACTLTGDTFTLGSAVQVKTRGGVPDSVYRDFCAALAPYKGSGTRVQTIQLQLSEKMNLPAEGYTMRVTKDRVEITASTVQGLFYGRGSLLQLLRTGAGRVPTCEISDAPRMSWRAFALDESRHFFGKQKVFQLLEIMADLKLNVFHWHLTDEPGWRIEIKRYPRLTTIGATGVWEDGTAAPQFYTQDEIREVVRYATARGIMVVPEIDMPGHATSVGRAYEEVSAGGEGRWKHFTYHPAKESTYEFLTNVLIEVMELFPAPYIHIGGDEVKAGNKIWKTDPVIQAFIKEHDLGDERGMEQYFMRRMAAVVNAHGKTAIGWDEIAEAGIDPKNLVVMWWRHDEPEVLSRVLEQGYRVIMAPRRPLYLDYVEHESHQIGLRGNQFNTFEKVCQFTDTLAKRWTGREEQIIGMEAVSWTERVADAKRLDFITFPRLIGAAEVAWTPAAVKSTELMMRKLPFYLTYLDSLGIYYFDPFDPTRRPEPWGPTKGDTVEDI